MEGTSLTLHSLSSSSPSFSHHSLRTQLRLYLQFSYSPLNSSCFEKSKRLSSVPNTKGKNRGIRLFCPPRTSVRTPELSVDETIEKSKETVATWMPKVDKSGRFCSPRAARELALSIVYASCLEGSDPIRLFEKRINARRESDYEFDKATLLEYNPMSFGGPPVTTETIEEADELLHSDEKESIIEAEVLSAPPKLVYSKLVLRLARKLLVAVVDKWDNHVLVIDKVAPQNWKNEAASRILDFSILHLAMAEIAVLETRPPIVINEAVDLAKRFCDGAAPRIINGCLRTFVKEYTENATSQAADPKQRLYIKNSI